MEIKIKKIMPGNYIFREHDPSNSMFIIKSGQVEILKERSGMVMRLTQLHAGQLFGDAGFFELKPRTYSARALEEVELIEMPYSDLKKEYTTLPSWSKLMMVTMSIQNSKLSQEMQDGKEYSIDTDEGMIRNVAKYLGFTLLIQEKTITEDYMRQVISGIYEIPFYKFLDFMYYMKDAGLVSIDSDARYARNFSILNKDMIEEMRHFMVSTISNKRFNMLMFSNREYIVMSSIANLIENGNCLEYRGGVAVNLSDIVSKAKEDNDKMSAGDIESLPQKGIEVNKVMLKDEWFISLNKEDVLVLSKIWTILNRAKNRGGF